MNTPEESSHDYIIAVKRSDGTAERMGKVLSRGNALLRISPWNFSTGEIDNDAEIGLNPDDHIFIHFESEGAMDAYFARYYLNWEVKGIHREHA